MAASDWTFISDALSSGSVARGVTTGVARPSGGQAFVYGMASLLNSPGVVALYTNQASFAPMAKGTQVTGCLKRLPSGGPTKFAPFLFAAANGNSSAAIAYMLGLSDADPHRIELRKGSLAGGLPDSVLGVSGVIQKSTNAFAVDTWLQLRLDVIANLNGDVILNVFQNDLGANPCNSPIWTAIPGMPAFTDDALQINTGSAPLVGGYAGFGAQFADVTRRVAFDELTVERQL